MSVSIYPVPLSGIQEGLIDAKGDLLVGSAADTAARLAVGTNDQVLTADSSATNGVKWATPASSSGPAFLAYRSSNTATVNGVWTKTPFNAESFDTDNCFDSTTNYRFTPNKAGYYSIDTQVVLTISPVKWAQLRLYFNGNIVRNTINDSQDGSQALKISTLFYFNGSSDYLEVYYYIEGTGEVQGNSTNWATWFNGSWIRS